LAEGVRASVRRRAESGTWTRIKTSPSPGVGTARILLFSGRGFGRLSPSAIFIFGQVLVRTPVEFIPDRQLSPIHFIALERHEPKLVRRSHSCQRLSR